MSTKVEQAKTETFIVKTAWHEVTLQEFLDIGRIQEDENLEDLNIQKRVRIMAVVSNMTYKDLFKMSGDMLKVLLNKTAFLDKTPPKRNKAKTFFIDKVEYMFHPNFKKLTAGEIISVEQLIMDSKEKGVNSTPGVLAILFRPAIWVPTKDGKGTRSEIEDFDTDSFEERKNIFLEKLTVDNFHHELAFFLNSVENKELTTLLSTETKSKQKKKKETKPKK